MKRGAVLARLVALSVVLTVLAGCGASPVIPTQPEPPTTRGVSPTEPVSIEPTKPASTRQSVFVYALPDPFPDLDPAKSYSSESYALSNCYETLVFYNPPDSPELLTGKLATRWGSNEDATEWTFHLREGVKFQDGSPFTAEAVKYSLMNTKEIGVGAAYILDPIAEIEVVDDLTVRFKLSYAAPLDLILSAGYGAWIYSPKAYEENGTEWFNEGHCLGTGPYTIESYDPGSRMVMTRFDDYWGGWKEGQFDTIVFDRVLDAVVLQQKIESGDADFTYNVPPDNIPALEQNPDLRVYKNASFVTTFAQYNTQKPPLDDKRVRQAISYAFPYDDLLTAMGGRAVLAHGPVPPGMWGHSDEIFQFSYDLDKASQLLAEAGHPDGGFKLVMTYVGSDLDEQQLGELWKAELAKLGIELELRGMSWEAQWDLGKSGPENAQDIFVQHWWPDYMSPITFLYGLFHSEEEVLFNLNYYANPEFDKLIDDANALSGSDRDKAAEMFIAAQEILMEDIPCLHLYSEVSSHISRSDVQGFVPNPAYPHVVFVYDLTRQ